MSFSSSNPSREQSLKVPKGSSKGLGRDWSGTWPDKYLNDHTEEDSSVVTKPVIGVFDLAANVTEGIRNTTTVFDNPARDRVRLVRRAFFIPYKSSRESFSLAMFLRMASLL